MQADGTIKIDTSINEDGFKAGSKDIELSVKRMTKSIEGLSDKAKIALQKQVDAFTKSNAAYSAQAQKVEELEKKVEEFANQKIPTDEYNSLQSQLEKANDAFDKLVDKEERFVATGGDIKNRTFQQMEYDVEKTAEKIKSLESQIKELEDSGKAFTLGSDTEEAQKDIARLEAEEIKLENMSNSLNTSYQSLKQKVSEYGAELASASAEEEQLAQGAEQISSGGGIFSGLISGARSLAECIGKAAAEMAKLVGSGIIAGLKKISAGIFGINKSANKSTLSFKKMLMYGLGFRSLYTVFSKLRSYITDGFQNLAQYSNETNAALSGLKSGLTQLKNSIATAFAPILSSAAPMLISLINLLNEATNAIARFVATISGKSSYTKATAVQEDYADAISATGDAAEEAEGQLASFDKLNVQNSNSSSSSGSSGGTSASDMFTTEEIEPISFDSWGEAFDQFLDYLLNTGIPALQDGLSQLADWINTFSENLYEMFTFPGVAEKVALLGQEVANALNDFVNEIDWETLGGALGAGLNLALTFMVNFIYTFDWKNLGSKLAEMFNSAISEIDGTLVGQWLWAPFKIGLETLAGFLENVDMAQLAQSASQVVIGLFDSMTETVQKIDWQKLGNQIIDFVANINFSGIATSVSTAIGSALGGLAALLGEIIGAAIDEAKNYFSEKIVECGGDIGLGILNGIIDAFKNIGVWINNYIVLPFINAFKEKFNISSSSAKRMNQYGGDVGEGILEGIAGKFDNIDQWVDEHIVTPFNNALKSLFGINASSSTVTSKLGKLLIMGLLEGVSGTFALIDIVSWLDENIVDPFVNAFCELFGINSPSTVMAELGVFLIEGLLNGLTSAWDTITSWLSTTLESIKKAFSDAWNDVKTTTTSIWEGIASSLKGIINGIIGSVESMVNAVIKAINALGSGIGSIVSGVGDLIGLDISIPTLSEVHLPRLASGTVVPPRAGEYAAILGDNNKETEVVSPLSTMKQALTEALQESGIGSSMGGKIELTVNLDGKQIYQSVVEMNRASKKQTGKNLLLV